MSLGIRLVQNDPYRSPNSRPYGVGLYGCGQFTLLEETGNKTWADRTCDGRFEGQYACLYRPSMSEGATSTRSKETEDETVVEKYEWKTPLLPSVAARVEYFHAKYPAKSYGLVLWSHGKGGCPRT